GVAEDAPSAGGEAARRMVRERGMLNVEWSMLNAFNTQHSTFNIPVLCLLLVSLATSLSANELSVDKRIMQLDDTITITVTLEDAFASIDAIRVPLRNLAMDGQPSVSSADKTSAFEGEEVIVTWTLYNATSVQQYAIAEIPKLEDFWTEELNVRGEQPQQVLLDGMAMQKLPIRRVALFPLRSGSLTVPAMGVNASIMKRIRTGSPFDLFEGMEVDVHRRSAPLSLHARAIPPG